MGALLKACYAGHIDVVQLLLRAGAEVDALDTAGYSSLAFAASFNHVGVLQLLLAESADPNAQDEFGVTPLIHAAARGQEYSAVVRELLRSGAKVELVDSEGRTAMDYAHASGHGGMIAQLHLHDVQFNGGGNTTQRGPGGSLTARAMIGKGRDDNSLPMMTPRVPFASDAAAKMEAIATPRAYQAWDQSRAVDDRAGVLLGRPHASSEPQAPAELSRAITPVMMSATEPADLSFLTRKLINLSILLEQDTLVADMAYPSIRRPCCH